MLCLKRTQSLSRVKTGFQPGRRALLRMLKSQMGSPPRADMYRPSTQVTATAHDEWLLFKLEDIPVGDVKIRPGVEFCGILDELDYDDDQAHEFDLLCDFRESTLTSA